LVAGGAITTLVLVVALAYWIDREWRELDRESSKADPSADARPESDDPDRQDEPKVGEE
jgi:hypothetical protein